jgi:hypothetical protein
MSIIIQHAGNVKGESGKNRTDTQLVVVSHQEEVRPRHICKLVGWPLRSNNRTLHYA